MQSRRAGVSGKNSNPDQFCYQTALHLHLHRQHLSFTYTTACQVGLSLDAWVGYNSGLTVGECSNERVAGGRAYLASINNRLRGEAPGKRRKLGCYLRFVACSGPLHELTQELF